MNEKIELLAPAGNKKSFEAALKSGANAIYMGAPIFNARTMAENFSIDDYKECILKAHILNVKVYLTLNTLLFDDEIEEALNLVLELYSAGVDAVIVQDIGLAMKIHNILPFLSLHASTQMSVYSLEQVNFLKSLGFSRVVLARELTISEIEHITKNTDMEIEVFVHGALCVSFSGQCLMSALIGRRSANRGKCAQPCRMKYTLLNSKNKEIISSSYLLSKKDTYGLKYVNKLRKIGVTSLKIEGRNKSPEYVYITTSTYRKYIDSLPQDISVDPADEMNLLQIFNRGGMSSNYLDGIKKEESITLKSPKNMGLYLGKVILQNKKFVKVKLENDIELHDGIEIYGKDGTKASTIVTCIKDDFYNIKNEKIEKGNYVFLGDIQNKVSPGDDIYKTSSYTLNKRAMEKIDSKYYCSKRKINVEAVFSLGQHPKYITSIKDKKIEVDAEYKITSAMNKCITASDINNNLSKNKDFLFEFDLKDYTIDDNIYVPVSVLNELRRNLNEKLINEFKVNKKLDNILIKDVLNLKSALDNKGHKEYNNSLYIYKYSDSSDYKKVFNNLYNENKKLNRIYIEIGSFYGNVNKLKNIVDKYDDLDVYVSIPSVVFENYDKFIKENINDIISSGIKGFLLGSFTYLLLIKENMKNDKLKLIADYSLNVTNSYSAEFLKSMGFDAVTPSIEVSEDDIVKISQILPVDIICDKISVMTSRYCILSSFLRDKSIKKCSKPCIKDNYKLKDEYGYIYDILADNVDCVMRIIKKIRNIDNSKLNNFNLDTVRRTII